MYMHLFVYNMYVHNDSVLYLFVLKFLYFTDPALHSVSLYRPGPLLLLIMMALIVIILYRVTGLIRCVDCSIVSSVTSVSY